MGRMLWFAFLFVAILGVLAGPIVADAKPEAPRWAARWYGLVGEVTAVDTAEGTVAVRVLSGNALAKQFIGQETLLVIGATTRFWPPGITLDMLAVGSVVRSTGIYTKGQFLAQHVILMPESKPKPFELVGVVTAVDAQAHTLSVRVLKGNAVVKPYIGKDVSIGVTANTRYLPPTTKLADLKGLGVKVQGIYTDSVFVGHKITITSARPKGVAGKDPKASKGPKADDPEGDRVRDKSKGKDKGNGASNSGVPQTPRGKSAPGRTKQKK